MKTEVWWFELRLWPLVVRVEAEVVLEERERRPGMRSYACPWNDLVYSFWRAVAWLRR